MSVALTLLLVFAVGQLLALCSKRACWFAPRVCAGYVTLLLPNRGLALPMTERIGVQV
jgi:hypothetical protein